MNIAFYTANNLEDLSALFGLMRIEKDPAMQGHVETWIRHKISHHPSRWHAPVSVTLAWDERGVLRKHSAIQFFR
jgi:hypothetical protein